MRIKILAFNLLAGFLFVQNVNAAMPLYDYPVVNYQNPDDFGQAHLYDVLFRGNGEAIVRDEINFINSEEEQVSKLLFKIPEGVKITDLKFWEYVDGKRCIEYPDKPVAESLCNSAYAIPQDKMTDMSYLNTFVEKYYYVNSAYLGRDSTLPPPIAGIKCYDRETGNLVENSLCMVQKNIDTYASVQPPRKPSIPHFIVNTSPGWQLGKTEIKNSEIILNLSNPIGVKKKASFIMRYRASGFAKNGLFGRRSFEFKTLVAETEIKSVNVNVNVDKDLYFEGKKSTVSYESNPVFSSKADLSVSSELGMPSGRYYDYDYYPYNNTFRRSAQYLATGEFLTVEGTFANSWFGYNYPKIVWTVLIFGLLITGIVFLWKYLARKSKEAREKALNSSKHEDSSSEIDTKPHILSYFLWGLISAIGFVSTSIVTIWGVQTLTEFNRRFEAPFIILGIFVSFVAIIISFLAGPVYFGKTRNHGLAVLCFEILFSIIALSIYAFIQKSVL